MAKKTEGSKPKKTAFGGLFSKKKKDGVTDGHVERGSVRASDGEGVVAGGAPVDVDDRSNGTAGDKRQDDDRVPAVGASDGDGGGSDLGKDAPRDTDAKEQGQGDAQESAVASGSSGESVHAGAVQGSRRYVPATKNPRTLTDADVESEGGSCWWFKLSVDKGVKLFKYSDPDSDTWNDQALKEARYTVLAAEAGVGPKVFGIEAFQYQNEWRLGIVMQRFVGMRGPEFLKLHPERYGQMTQEAQKKLRERSGITLIEPAPKNVVIVDDKEAKYIDYGPVHDAWPKWKYGAPGA